MKLALYILEVIFLTRLIFNLLGTYRTVLRLQCDAIDYRLLFSSRHEVVMRRSLDVVLIPGGKPTRDCASNGDPDKD